MNPSASYRWPRSLILLMRSLATSGFHAGAEVHAACRRRHHNRAHSGKFSRTLTARGEVQSCARHGRLLLRLGRWVRWPRPKALADVDANVLQGLVAKLHEAKYARSSIESVLNRALEILRHAREHGYAAHEIRRSALKLPSDSRAEREQRYITPPELARLMEASHSHPERRALWATLALTGLRIAEALGLGTWPHVDLCAGVISVRQSCVCGKISGLKTKRSRRDVPILPELLEVLQAYRLVHAPNPQQLLFASSQGTALRADDVRRRWLAPLLRRLRIAPAGCHAFRHSVPAMLDRIGLTPTMIQRWMGHQSIEMTMRYLHTDEDLRVQLNRALAGRGEHKT
jgi:integrase